MSAPLHAFPPDCLECRPGDHLLRQEPPGHWTVYLVEDVLAVKRLMVSQPIPNAPDAPATLLPENTVLDSMRPAYFGEVQLLLSVFDPAFKDPAAAAQALQAQAITQREQGLLRPARDFPKATCQVLKP